MVKISLAGLKAELVSQINGIKSMMAISVNSPQPIQLQTVRLTTFPDIAYFLLNEKWCEKSNHQRRAHHF
jgi:hypothetical protein